MHFQDIEILNTIGRLKTLKELKMNDCTHPYMKDMYNLKFKLPQELGNLEQLERLSIDNCFLETLPDTLCFLQQLRYLSIRNNYIKVIPKGVLELPSLCELYAEGNQLKKEQKRLSKLVKERPGFITDQKIDFITGIQEAEKNINSILLAPEVLSEIVRLGISSEDIGTQERYFTPVDREDEAIIPPAMVQLLWGFCWKQKKLMWKEPPFTSEETWNDEAYLEGDEDYVQRERCLEISYAFYLEESFCIGEDVYLAIGYFQSSGQPYRICISLKDEHMENPEVFVHDYVAEEPSNLNTLSAFLNKLTTEEM
jgi:Leucine-rich repeat (LRR) protein